VTAHIEAASPHTMNTYARLPIAMDHGQGCYVWDVNGKRYLDGLGGIAVNTLGHNHPKLVPALQEQIGKIIHSSNYYHVPNAEVLAKKLTELANMTNVFFCCTGLEANEAALKLARKFGHDKGIDKPQMLKKGAGLFGEQVLSHYAGGAIEDEMRLSNLSLREHFLIKLFTLARFRRLCEQPTMGALVAFHASHKLKAVVQGEDPAASLFTDG